MRQSTYVLGKTNAKWQSKAAALTVLAFGLLLGVGVVTSTSNSAMAKGKSTNEGSSSFLTVAGPCSREFSNDSSHIVYPLSNDKYPGAVAVDMLYSAGSAPSISSVCLEAGWTAEAMSATNGVQLRFSYNGVKAIDFKFVLGKTDIRNY